MQVQRINYQVNATPTFEVLSEDEIEAIYYSALRVLYETGECTERAPAIVRTSRGLLRFS